MGIIEALVRRRVLTTVLVLIAVILGGLSYVGLGLRRFPDIEFPVATVITHMTGGSPAEIETDITTRIEDAVSPIAGIEEITSYSQQGRSVVMIEFDLDEDIDLRAIDVRDAVDRIQHLLPDGADDPFVMKFDIGMLPVMAVALTGPQDVNELFRLADEDLAPLIARVGGVADVDITGGQEREVHVLLDARKLRKHRLSVGSVATALQQANLDVPAGFITQPGREYIVRATGRLERVDQIPHVHVPAGGGGFLTVGDLGEVVDTYEERRTASRFNDGTAVVMTVQPQSDANEVEVVDGVRALLPRLQEMLPEGAELVVADDTAEYVRGALANVFNNMLIGILLTAVVLYLFLKSWRSTFIAAVAIPTAVVVTFVGMMASGFSLNILTLTGLAIVIGVLVNNAILILENVTRFVHEGHEPVEAATTGTQEIALAVISSTATNLVVFIPIAFMGEIVGQFFRELGLTVVYATVVSLLVSFSLTPMMCGLLLRENEDGGGAAGWLRDHSVGLLADAWRWVFDHIREFYLEGVRWCLRHRVATLLLTGALFFASLGAFGVVGVEFMPRGDEGVFRISVEGPAGMPLDETERVTLRVESMVRELPHLESYYSRIGAVRGIEGEAVNLAEVTVNVTDRAERAESVDELMNMIRPWLADIPGVRITVEEAGHGPQMEPVLVEIAGDCLEDIERTAGQVFELVRRTPGTAETDRSWQPGQPEVRLVPRREALKRHRIDFNAVAQEVRAYVDGRVATEFRDGDENYDLVVRLREQDRMWADDVYRMFIHSPATGSMIPISEVARIEHAESPTLIMRQDRQRMHTVSADLTGERSLGAVLADIRQGIDTELDVPEDVSITFGGEAELMRRNFRELYQAMAIAAVLTFLCIAGIIESFRFAVVIILTLPVCLIGVALAMLIAGVPISLFSLMAMIILVGLVVNNAIIIVDYAMRRERDGEGPREAILSACGTRFRMIVMANLTTIAALVPLSLGLGFAGEIFRPLAVVQMGGVFAAGGLSLLVIPVIYLWLQQRRSN